MALAIRSLEERFWEKVRKTDGCWLWTGAKNDKGYGQIRIVVADGASTSIYAHRSSWQQKYGDIPEGLCVLHKCDTTLCVRPDHLFLGTQADNMLDMASKGRGLKRFTASDLLLIKDLYTGKRGEQKALALQLGVTQRNISSAVKRLGYSKAPKRMLIKSEKIVINELWRNRVANPVTQTEIGRLFGVSRSAVGNIIRNL